MKWSESAWRESSAVYEKILQHPFNLELMNGTLHVEKFKFYIAQDSVYLGAFSRALALIAVRTNHLSHTLEFIRFAEGALVTEKLLHVGYFEKFGLSDEAQASLARDPDKVNILKSVMHAEFCWQHVPDCPPGLPL